LAAQRWKRRTIEGWCVEPAPAALDDMDDAADHPSIVNTRFASCVGGKMRLQLRELLVAQPKIIAIHQCLLAEALNHILAISETP
jgi:hypothetical protein